MGWTHPPFLGIRKYLEKIWPGILAWCSGTLLPDSLAEQIDFALAPL